MKNRYRRKTIKTGWEIGLKDNYRYVDVPIKKLKSTLMVIHDPEKGKSEGYMIITNKTERYKPHIQRGTSNLPDQEMVYIRWFPYQRKTELSVINGLANNMTLDRLKQMRQSLSFLNK